MTERGEAIRPTCKGTGEDWSDVSTDSGALNGEACPACNGSGHVTLKERIENIAGTLSVADSPRTLARLVDELLEVAADVGRLSLEGTDDGT